MPSASCISTRAASSNGSLPRERLRPGPEKPVPPQIARQPDDRVDPDRLHDLRRARRILPRLHRRRGCRRRGPDDHRQQDQLHPADADRLLQSRARGRRGPAGDLRQLVRRLLSGPEELHHGARDRAEHLFRRLPQRIRRSARPASGLHPRPRQRGGRRKTGAEMGLEDRRSHSHLRATSSARRAAAIPGTSPLPASSRARSSTSTPTSCCSSTPISTRPAVSARTPSAG